MMNNLKFKIKNFILSSIVKRFGKNTICKFILNKSELEALKQVDKGFLNDNGWWNSWRKKEPLDKNSKPLPWVTYSYIDGLKDKFNWAYAFTYSGLLAFYICLFTFFLYHVLI